MAPCVITTVVALLSLLAGRLDGGPANQAATQPAATQPAATQPASDHSPPTTQPASGVVDATLAGKYYMGDDFWGLSLTLSEDGTFSCTRARCPVGVDGTASGTWSRAGDRISFVTLEATGRRGRSLLRGATVVEEGGGFAALVLDQYRNMYQEWGRSRRSALQRDGDPGWIEEPRPLLAQPAPATQPRKSWLRRLFTGNS